MTTGESCEQVTHCVHCLGPPYCWQMMLNSRTIIFDGIRYIGESGKRRATLKTGRFGVGFNTAYNVTDYPSLLSREWMICFDPHNDAIAKGREEIMDEGSCYQNCIFLRAFRRIASCRGILLERALQDHP